MDLRVIDATTSRVVTSFSIREEVKARSIGLQLLVGRLGSAERFPANRGWQSGSQGNREGGSTHRSGRGSHNVERTRGRRGAKRSRLQRRTRSRRESR